MHEKIEKYCKKIVAVGSRVTCDPAPFGTDQDYLVLLNKVDEIYEVAEVFEEEGFTIGGSEVVDAAEEGDPNGGFSSFKKGDINYILTANEEFFNKFIFASNIAKKLNLLEKEKRINLFQIILYDNFG